MKILIIIPARGGSKAVPHKNIKLLLGKPLISYIIETAQNSCFSPEITVSTDDKEIADISKKYNVKIINRPDELAGDDITLDSVVLCYYFSFSD